MTELLAVPRVVPVADHGVLVEFATTSSDEASARVRSVDAAIRDCRIDGVVDTVPAYTSVFIVFDPARTDHDLVAAAVAPLLDVARPDTAADRRRHVIPVCRDPDFAPDLAVLADRLVVSTDEVVSRHEAGEYRVEMFGFQPGCGYLRGVPEQIQVPRKETPVPGVAAGSVIVAGAQCLVTTLTMPTGWWVIGRTPVSMLSSGGDRPTVLEVGDEVVFESIDRPTFERLAS